ncbi:glycosyltransferase family 2 protein [Pedobacter frigiditerrae]|uniref:Glycosyltransferase family 2 protein n=1 Tax=Pedobacter frigiditerrae TaxID=2530452 RepID=A0A4R0MY94_9SPHI|nr:glycosyltransferase family 2 protein [Pedobacter frigiditerrae]TCC92255.1 glycosyltransferase family 2 protein [Pedobacter frigiditerrae]
MHKQPLVSICIPAYNAAQFIDDCINSLINQSYQNIEIIIVNDGSTDNTLAIIESYNDYRIKIVSQENKGQCSAANLAFELSNGEYIKFFDADDILSQEFIKSQVERLNGRSDAVASAAWGRFYQNDIHTFRLNPEIVWKDMVPLEWLIGSLNGASMMQCGLWLIPRSILKKSGLWNEKLSLINDFDFFIRVLLVSKEVLFSQNAILYYRSGIQNSLSGSKSTKAYLSAYLSTELGIKAILKYENSIRTRKVCANTFKLWSYDFYPLHMELYHKSNNWIKNLGGSDLRFPAGGKTRVLNFLLGWKLAKRLKLYFSRRVY